MKSNRIMTPMGISAASAACNILLSMGKLLAGLLGHSAAMIADAVHSASDVGSTLMVMLTLRVAGKHADAHHEYGHERFESLGTLLLAILLALTGLGIGYDALQNIFTGAFLHREPPTLLPLAAAVVSIAVKEWMFRITRKVARTEQSDALMADAWHHRSDAFSSIGSLLGVLGARLGLPVLDPLAGLVICLFILKSAWDILRPAVDKLTDASCDHETESAMNAIIFSVPGVVRVDELRTRRFGSRVYVDVEIAADGSLTLQKAHAIAELVHLQIETHFPSVKHCMVHVNPV